MTRRAVESGGRVFGRPGLRGVIPASAGLARIASAISKSNRSLKKKVWRLGGSGAVAG